MARLGAHLSAAGGVLRTALAACQLSCEALQLFLRPPGRWAITALLPEEAQRFRAQAAASPLYGRCFAHAPYLLNLASDREELRRRSVTVLVEELQRADALGLAGVVLHPGSAGRGNRQEAAARFRAALAEVRDRAGEGDAALVLEGTAGAGGQLGRGPRELADLLPHKGWKSGRKVGVCLDTAHLWAAGYRLPSGGWESVLAELQDSWELPVPNVIHANDTPVACGSHSDRHLPPGEGALGEVFFRHLLGDPRIAETPAVVEIPPGPHNALVAAALERLRRWVACSP